MGNDWTSGVDGIAQRNHEQTESWPFRFTSATSIPAYRLRQMTRWRCSHPGHVGCRRRRLGRRSSRRQTRSDRRGLDWCCLYHNMLSPLQPVEVINTATPAEFPEKVRSFWPGTLRAARRMRGSHLLPHFRVEEQVLLRALAAVGATELANRTRAEHRELGRLLDAASIGDF